MSGAWIVCPKPNPTARLRLLCFPYAGVGASLFGTWWTDLPREVEVWAVQPPGRETRWKEPPETSLESVARTFAEVVAPRLDTPFAVFGHSVGALIGFEVVRRLRRMRGLSPVRLFVSGRRGPQIPLPHPPIHQLSDGAFIDEIRRRYGGIPEAIMRHADLVALMLPALRADVAMLETYAYVDEAPLDCPVSAFGGLEDRDISDEDLAAWRHQTHGAFRLRMLPGDHFFVKSARGLLLKAVAEELA